jgi:hypothetical protein
MPAAYDTEFAYPVATKAFVYVTAFAYAAAPFAVAPVAAPDARSYATLTELADAAIVALVLDVESISFTTPFAVELA